MSRKRSQVDFVNAKLWICTKLKKEDRLNGFYLVLLVACWNKVLHQTVQWTLFMLFGFLTCLPQQEIHFMTTAAAAQTHQHRTQTHSPSLCVALHTKLHIFEKLKVNRICVQKTTSIEFPFTFSSSYFSSSLLFFFEKPTERANNS